MAGEGAVAVVLERSGDAHARGRQPIAEIAGLAQTFDAREIGPTSSMCDWLEADLSGAWLVQAIEQSLLRADCQSAMWVWLSVTAAEWLPTTNESWQRYELFFGIRCR